MQPQTVVHIVTYIDVNGVSRMALYAFFEKADATRYANEKKNKGTFKSFETTEVMLSGINKNPAYRLWTLITRGREIENGELYE
jgi:hypothetical protein